MTRSKPEIWALGRVDHRAGFKNSEKKYNHFVFLSMYFSLF